MTEPGPSRRLALLMADVAGSTALHESIGDRSARHLIGECLQRLDEVARRHRGQTVKTLGDGILCTFPDAASAVDAAREMARGAQANSLAIRIAAHIGVVLQEDGDVFGDTVNTVARIAGLAAAGEILVSRVLFDDVPELRLTGARSLPPVPVKGKREPLQVVSLVATRGATAPRTALIELRHSPEPARLLLTYEDVELTVTDECPVEIGRDPANTLTIEHAAASRFHARIFPHGRTFVLADQSSNGTWIVPHGHAAVHIHRRETTVLGSGRIHIGADPAVTPTEPLHYRWA